MAARTGHVVRRRDGTSVPLEQDLARYSTPELLALERRIIAGARARALEDVARVHSALVDLALRRRPQLSASSVASWPPSPRAAEGWR